MSWKENFKKGNMEVLGTGVELELQLLAYTTAKAMWDPRPTEQGQGSNLYPDISQIRFCCATTGTPTLCFLIETTQ